MRVCFALFFLIATGCASVQTPSASVHSASVQSISADAVTIGLAVDLHNPNAFALPLSAADYSVRVAGSKLFDGAVETTGTVPANGSLALTVPVSFRFADLLDVGNIIRQSDGSLQYALDGGINVGSMPLTRRRVPIAYHGTLSLTEIVKNPKILLAGGAAAKLARKVLGGYFGHE